VDLLSAFLPNVARARTGGVAISSALLAAPAVIVARAGTGALVAAGLFVAAAVLLETRIRPATRAPVRRPVALAAVPGISRGDPVLSGPRARWEVVERDGQRSLSMRWS